MFCHTCGNSIKDNALFCPKCGVKQVELREALQNAPVDQTPVTPSIEFAVLNPQFLSPPYSVEEGAAQVFSAADKKGRVGYTVMTPKRIYLSAPNCTITGKVKPGYWTEGSIDWTKTCGLKSFRAPGNICAINVIDVKTMKVVKGIVSPESHAHALSCAMELLAQAWDVETSLCKNGFSTTFARYKEATLSGQLDNYAGALMFNGIVPYVAEFTGKWNQELTAIDEYAKDGIYLDFKK